MKLLQTLFYSVLLKENTESLNTLSVDGHDVKNSIQIEVIQDRHEAYFYLKLYFNNKADNNFKVGFHNAYKKIPLTDYDKTIKPLIDDLLNDKTNKLLRIVVNEQFNLIEIMRLIRRV